ncbi:MAG: hypothetical protein IPH12_12550 [Saprospirales bacterium]|nr:hypothetical protein [Saprospirales bacterium]MBK8921194.1 hypothetical protein [Saprospirales bacterium]
MKKTTLLAGFLMALLFSCTNSGKENILAGARQTLTESGLQIHLNANPEWQYENLRLYPVTADQSLLQVQAALPAMKTLAEGMETPGFRITERKQFGREQGRWFNALTVQNKSRDTIFLMSGDVVTGGNQDRVIAYDDVIPPGTVKNIEVFCVEAGRGSYYDPAAPEAEKKVAAFRGYYNVASPRVRQAVYSGNQQGVWKAVEQVTVANNAASQTKTYAALDTENDQKARREAYLHFFEGKFADMPDAVGVVAVSGGRVIGADVFGRPELFQRQFRALLHGYATEAAIAGNAATPASAEAVSSAFRQVARMAGSSGSTEQYGKFNWNGHWVHLFKK